MSIIQFILRKYQLRKQERIRKSLSKCGNNVNFGRGGVIVGSKYIEVGEGTSFSDNLVLTAWSEYSIINPQTGAKEIQHFTPKITFGSNCNIGRNNHITAIQSISIGSNLLTGHHVTISDNAHGYCDIQDINIPPSYRPLTSKGHVVIGDNVWIGEKATILAGSTIGNNVIIGANAVVTKSIPDNAVAVGIPAKVIKYLK